MHVPHAQIHTRRLSIHPLARGAQLWALGWQSAVFCLSRGSYKLEWCIRSFWVPVFKYVLYVLRISIIKTEDGREVTGVPVFPQLPRFFQLCSDNVWGVRKACAECFMAVSCATCQEIRRTKLSALFINLISDPSRWVTLLFKNILRLK